VTVTRKLFIAAVLITAGYGVARFLGEPNVQLYAPGSPNSAAAAHNTAVAARSASTNTTPLLPAGARLVPDFGSNNTSQLRAEPKTDVAELAQNFPLKTNSYHTQPSSAVAQTAPPQVAEPASPAYTPLVKLRDEAPRPLDFASRDRAEPQNTPLVQPPLAPSPVETPVTAAPPLLPPPNAALELNTPHLQPAGYAAEPNAAPVSTVTASYSQPELPAAVPSNISPPPWPERQSLRTHVVIDGDSLERLAGRYLDDPARAVEIFEANRELLSNPDLLPIGAELVIPEIHSRSAFERTVPQSSLARDPSVREAAHQVMVPVRPIPRAGTLVPRARLLPPVAAE
jgi:hypothetical protein